MNSFQSITIGFDEFKNSPNDESLIARNFANLNGVNHSASFISYDDFEENYDNFFYHMDQPTVDGLNTYFVSKAVSEAGLKVALSGLGGDEIFRGYSNFRSIPRHLSLMSKLRPDIFGESLRNAFKGFLIKKPKLSSILEYSETVGHSYFLHRALFLPWELENFLEKNVIDSGLEKLSVIESINNSSPDSDNDLIKISALEMQWYMKNQLLRDSDWASMAHSLELRVPFVDIKFISKILSLQNSGLKLDKDYLKNHFKSNFPKYLISKK